MIAHMHMLFIRAVCPGCASRMRVATVDGNAIRIPGEFLRFHIAEQCRERERTGRTRWVGLINAINMFNDTHIGA